MMRLKKWVPPLVSCSLAFGLGAAAGLGDWSVPAIYGCTFAAIFVGVGLFAFTDEMQDASRASRRRFRTRARPGPK